MLPENAFQADYGAHCIVRCDLTTKAWVLVAGTGDGVSGAGTTDGIGNAARFSNPSSVAIDPVSSSWALVVSYR